MPFISVVLLGLMLLSGCAPLSSPRPEENAATHRPYISEVDLPAAKAYFGYAQFRMLIADSRWDEAITALKRTLSFDPHSVPLQLTLAKAYLHNRQLEEGGQTLEKLLRKDPEQLEGWELLGGLRAYQDRYPEAIRAYQRVLQENPANETLRLRLIALYTQQKNLPKALAETHRLLALNPDSLPGRLAQARIQRANRQTRAAIKTYRDLLMRRPGQLQAILELGQLYEKEKKVGQAIDLYRKSIKNHPEQLVIYQQLSRILILQEHYAEALSLLKRAAQQRPDDPQILNRVGLLQLSREDYLGAEQTFRKILKLRPDEPRNLYSLGMALIGQQRNEDALKVLSRIPSKSDVYADAVLQLAYLYRQTGDLERGIRLLQQSVARGDQAVAVYDYLAAFLGEAGRFAAAGQAVRKGIEIFPKNARLHYQLGVIYERMDDRQQALGEMEKVLELEPKNPDALNFIAYSYAELGENLDQALIQAQQALTQKKTGYIYDTLGWIYFRMKRFDEARQHLEQAVSLDPDDPRILEHLGDVYRAQQRWAAAAKTYRKSLKFDKDSSSVSVKLQNLLKDHPAP